MLYYLPSSLLACTNQPISCSIIHTQNGAASTDDHNSSQEALRATSVVEATPPNIRTTVSYSSIAKTAAIISPPVDALNVAFCEEVDVDSPGGAISNDPAARFVCMESGLAKS